MFPFDPPKNTIKLLVFWCFQEGQKGALGRKGLNWYPNIKSKLPEKYGARYPERYRCKNIFYLNVDKHLLKSPF